MRMWCENVTFMVSTYVKKFPDLPENFPNGDNHNIYRCDSFYLYSEAQVNWKNDIKKNATVAIHLGRSHLIAKNWDDDFCIVLYVNIHETIDEQEKYRKDFIKNDSSLTENEKKFLLDELRIVFDEARIGDDSVEKQQCNNCQNWHQASQYCEFCIRKHLENNFGNWTSGNNEIDKLIQECQQKTVAPHKVIEWIEYDQIEDVKHLTEGGCATIYTAGWKDGYYVKWNSERQTLERFGRQKIVLKRLNNSSNNNVNWFHEVTLSFTLDKTSSCLVNCYGLTKDPTTQDYMLVLNYHQTDLRHFLKDNYQSLTLLQKYKIIFGITDSLCEVHEQNISHRDLHSGNFLYDANVSAWYISDLGFSGPVDKQLDSIYGNLPYIAPELLCKKDYTTKSDMYSFGIIMWEVITGETPFSDHEFNSDSELALAIINGCRPKIYKYIPYEYATLMKQCWDANPDNRPDAIIIYNKFKSLIRSLYMDKQQEPTIQSNSSKSKISQSSLTKDKSVQKIQTSKVYTFDISAKPRNATEEEQKAYETKQFDFEISEDMYSFGIIMWEVITGETPFSDHEFNSDSELALAIINGCRPKIYKYIPYEYATLMKQCWDANPDNRPDAIIIYNKFKSLIRSLYMDKQQEPTIQSNSSKSKISQSSLTKDKSVQKIQTSKVYTFDISAKPRNATEEEQKAYETKQFDFEISEEFEQLSLNNADDQNGS
ncbi:hypothetical protein Glove_362g36 [Diversispora epigaea]|uniref:Protein kinase domain-containing protein n=1 Tax=Diversispora epigaea TaxID=1348612 RepID=A0A397HGX1_9GLOM|nr:hypothetical protein Glove_362g36 [Diversispora epigaea]